jgi:hypothetical protein
MNAPPNAVPLPPSQSHTRPPRGKIASFDYIDTQIINFPLFSQLED